MFYIYDDIVSYADANTPCASSSNLDVIIKKIEENTNNLLHSLRNMKAIADKCHLLVTGNYL